MHSAIIVSDESSLEELNQLLAEEGWWISQVAAGSEGTWLVILTDKDPERGLGEEEYAEESIEH